MGLLWAYFVRDLAKDSGRTENVAEGCARPVISLLKAMFLLVFGMYLPHTASVIRHFPYADGVFLMEWRRGL